MNTNSDLTRLQDYIKEILPWAHGHQLKAITTFVSAIFDKQTGCQAQLARTLGNQEAAARRLSRLLHNQRLKPQDLADWVCRAALDRLPRTGPVRLTIDWTIEADQHLLVVSLLVGRRALPIFWRGYDQRALKGRMKRYELAVLRRAFKLIFGSVSRRRVRLTADRGFADERLLSLLTELKVRFVIRVPGSTKVEVGGRWLKLNQLGFDRHQRRRYLGQVRYCERAPLRLWVTLSRARDRHGEWGIWHLVSNHSLTASQAATEYGCRFGCEEGFRDAKWWLGFKQARVRQIGAWSRLFGLFAIALLALTTLGTRLLSGGGPQASRLLRRVISRRRGRCELSLIAATLSLLQQDQRLIAALSGRTKLNLEATLSNVS